MNISFSTSDSPTTRTGKIARLPKEIRDRLNQQLRDNVPGTELVRWLNLMPEVQRLLVLQFHGRAITPQNLSEWKLGGYQDWLMHEERRDWAKRLDDEAQDLHTESSSQPLMENIASMFEVALGQAVMRFVDRPMESMEDLKPLLELSREVAKHRKLAAVSAKERQKQMDHLKQMGPAMAKVTRAKNLAMREMMMFMAQGTQEQQVTEKLTAEQKVLYAAEVQALTDRYYHGEYGYKGPGYAVGWEGVWKEIEEMMAAEDEDEEDAEEEGGEGDGSGGVMEDGSDDSEGDPGESDRIGVVDTEGSEEVTLSEIAEDRILANAPTTGGAEPCILANAPTAEEGDPSESDRIGVVDSKGTENCKPKLIRLWRERRGRGETKPEVVESPSPRPQTPE